MRTEKKLSPEHLKLRPALANDEDFLASVYAAVRRDELAPLGWNDGQIDAFCRMQFRLQGQAYQMQFPGVENFVIEIDGQNAGRLLIYRAENEIRLVDIAFLPDFRGCGAGTILVKNLRREAAGAGKPLDLRVLQTNIAAIRFYRRLGFYVVEENQTHLTMRSNGEE